MANAMQEVVKLTGGRNDPAQQLKKLRKKLLKVEELDLIYQK